MFLLVENHDTCCNPEPLKCDVETDACVIRRD
jgi:hypothetical protein